MRLSIVNGAVLSALLAVTSACGSASVGDTQEPHVVATTTQVGAIARELGGDDIGLTVLLAPGVEAHDFELTPDRAAALEEADLVLISGAGLEDWLEDTIEGTGNADRVRDLSEGIELRAPSDEEPAHEHDDNEGEAHADDVDPHYWLSGPNAIVMVENARDALVELAPASAEAIDDRAAELVARIEAADAEVRRLIAEIPPDERRIVTDHDALGYFVDEYGLEFVGSMFPSLDVSSEPSAREVEALIAEIRAAGVRAVFTESSVNPRLARAIAEESGARLVEEPIYTDSLGEEGSGADTLDRMLIHNARVIHGGLTGS